MDYYEASARCSPFTSTGCASAATSKAINTLPHDGVNENNITGKSYEDHLARGRLHGRAAGEEPGQGRGDDAHRGGAPAGPRLWWNEATTEAGRDALGFYHERKDDVRNVGLGPEHDWSSHAAMRSG